MNKALTALLAASTMFVGANAQAAILATFDNGAFGPAWTRANVAGSSPATFSAAAAHDGARGASDLNSSWYYRTDNVATVDPGETLSAWVRGGTGRFYLGFGATSAGASSFVAAFNTNQLLFQNNNSWTSFSQTDATSFAFTAGQWYKLTVSFGPSIVGRLYGSDGSTLLASLIGTNLTHTTGGGVAVRGFSNIAVDTIALNNTIVAPVPEPASWALMIGGLGLVACTLRRRKTSVAYA